MKINTLLQDKQFCVSFFFYQDTEQEYISLDDLKCCKSSEV